MSKIKSFIEFTGLTEIARVVIWELFPNFGKRELVRVRVNNPKFSQFLRNKMM